MSRAAPAVGSLAGIAMRPAPRQPLAAVARAVVAVGEGLTADRRAHHSPDRQVTVLAREAWDAACASLGQRLDWTVRRANLLVAGLDLAGSTGVRLWIGPVVLEITGETRPCRRMEVYPGLRDALAVGWRGGVTCRVITGGTLTVGDRIDFGELLHASL